MNPSLKARVFLESFVLVSVFRFLMQEHEASRPNTKMICIMRRFNSILSNVFVEQSAELLGNLGFVTLSLII